MKKDLNIQLEETIRQQRELLKPTREELAELAGANSLFMSCIETRRKRVSLTTPKK